MNTIYDEILWLRSKATNQPFPIAQFSGDTDMVTAGWISLTSTERTEIVVAQLTVEECCPKAKDTDRYLHAEQRVNSALKRVDLRCTWLVRVEEVGPSGKGLSFQEFLRVYQPRKLFYRDIFNSASIAEVVSCVTRAEFERNGGKLIVLQ